MTQATDSSASATLSGRELALKRRKAMALHGKTGSAKAATKSRPSAQRVNPAPAAAVSTPAAASSATAAPAAASSDAPVVQAQSVVSSGRSASRARRQAMSLSGKAALGSTATRPTGRVRPQRAAAMGMASPDTATSAATAPAADTAKKGCGCGCNGTRASCDTSDSSASQMPAASTSSVASVTPAKQNNAPTGRALARARRAALSQDGKSGLKRVAQATKIASTMPAQNWEAAISRGATGRQVAMQRRMVQSLTGDTKPAAEKRPSGRMRARMETPAPAKVEEGHTLAGQGVTGTMVERSQKVTGNEPGSCRGITGTEYIGAEQYDSLCPTRPEPTPSKISVSQTSREHTVTGTSVADSTASIQENPATPSHRTRRRWGPTGTNPSPLLLDTA